MNKEKLDFELWILMLFQALKLHSDKFLVIIYWSSICVQLSFIKGLPAVLETSEDSHLFYREK